MTEFLLAIVAAELGYIAYMMLAVLDATRGIKANGDASAQRDGGSGEEGGRVTVQRDGGSGEEGGRR